MITGGGFFASINGGRRADGGNYRRDEKLKKIEILLWLGSSTGRPVAPSFPLHPVVGSTDQFPPSQFGLLKSVGAGEQVQRGKGLGWTGLKVNRVGDNSGADLFKEVLGPGQVKGGGNQQNGGLGRK